MQAELYNLANPESYLPSEDNSKMEAEEIKGLP